MDIGMKVQILRACSSKKGNRCSSCPAFGHGDRSCIRNAMKDAATALSTLQAENEKLRAELEKVKAERDAAVKDIIGLLYHADDSELVDIHQLELHIRERKEHNEL